jgi:hydroxyethylthiazole kinase-like uncharacterized protein yjeF
VAQVRAAEAADPRPEASLIERASTAVARRAVAMLGGAYGARVLVVAGPGHNGADALWAGVRLRERGAAVDVALPLGSPRDVYGAEPLGRLLSAGARRVTEGAAYDLTIDGVLGIGARPGPPVWAGLFGAGPVLAVDVPTGVDADTGAVAEGAVRAAVTVTFWAAKPGLLLAPEHAGLVEVVPLGPVEGASMYAVDAADVAPHVGPPPADSDKYRRGVVGVVAGSERYPGAAALACRGAQRAGCGYVRLRAPGSVADAVRAAHPEVVAGEGTADAWVVGPGLGTGDDALALLREVLATDRPVVVDADGLTLLAEHKDLLRRNAPTVLTPHTGEFARLTGVSRSDAANDRVGVTRRAAADLGAVVLLKGTTTVVSDGGTTWLNPTGTPWLGTAGTGDVLAGAIGALLSRSPDTLRAIAAAAWLHGLAGRLAAGAPGAAVTALDVADRLPEAARIAFGT